MKHLRRVLSLVLVACLLSTHILVFGAGSGVGDGADIHDNNNTSTSQQNTSTGTLVGGSSAGFGTTKTIRMALVELTNEDFSDVSAADLPVAIQEYGSKYYVTCPDTALYWDGCAPVILNTDVHTLLDAVTDYPF